METNLSDSEFLKFYCASAELIFNNAGSKSEGVFIKDTNHVFCFVSKTYLAHLEHKGTVLSKDILNKKRTKTLKNKDHQRFRDEAEAQDQLIANTRESLLYLYVDSCDRIGIIRKSPIINPASNNVVGVLGYVHPFVMPNMLEFIYQINQITTVQTDSLPSLPYKLTQRQHMVLFLCLHKYSYTEVAMILTNLGQKMSPGRVNEHLEKLKYIFAAQSKAELLEKASNLKYHLFVPCKFLKMGSHVIANAEVVSTSLEPKI